MWQAKHVLHQYSVLMITIKAKLTTDKWTLPLGVRTRKEEQCKGHYEKSAPAETTIIERLNTRNNTMSSNLIYTCDGDYVLRTNQ